MSGPQLSRMPKEPPAEYLRLGFGLTTGVGPILGDAADALLSRCDRRRISQSLENTSKGVGENYSDGCDQTVLELPNRFGANGWEPACLRDFREGGDGSSYWEAPGCSRYTRSNVPSRPALGTDWTLPQSEAALTP